MKLTIATRESPLALWQANHVRDELLKHFPDMEIELLGMTTKGDQLLSSPLSKIGGKGLLRNLRLQCSKDVRISPYTQ